MMGPRWPIAALALLAVCLMMAAEAAVSRRRERLLRARGAVEPSGDVIATMRWAYPAAFVVMAAEGAWVGRGSEATTLAGLGLFTVSKALKYWAMWSLGERWTFRVLVLPGQPLVTTGPCYWCRHPNYAAVVGELVGMALMAGAAVSGPVATALFLLLLRRRIRVEDRVLRHVAAHGDRLSPG